MKCRVSPQGTSMEWGVKANIAEPRSAMRTGALAWVVYRNHGSEGERICVLARSRGGRLITTWIGIKRLTNLRAAWMPEHLRSRCHTWEKKEDAAKWAKEMQDRWPNK